MDKVKNDFLSTWSKLKCQEYSRKSSRESISMMARFLVTEGEPYGINRFITNRGLLVSSTSKLQYILVYVDFIHGILSLHVDLFRKFAFPRYFSLKLKMEGQINFLQYLFSPIVANPLSYHKAIRHDSWRKKRKKLESLLDKQWCEIKTGSAVIKLHHTMKEQRTDKQNWQTPSWQLLPAPTSTCRPWKLTEKWLHWSCLLSSAWIRKIKQQRKQLRQTWMIDEEKASRRLSGAFPFLPVRAEIYIAAVDLMGHTTPSCTDPAHEVVKHRENFYIKEGGKRRHLRQMFAKALGCSLVDWVEELFSLTFNCLKNWFKFHARNLQHGCALCKPLSLTQRMVGKIQMPSSKKKKKNTLKINRTLDVIGMHFQNKSCPSSYYLKKL